MSWLPKSKQECPQYDKQVGNKSIHSGVQPWYYNIIPGPCILETILTTGELKYTVAIFGGSGILLSIVIKKEAK